MSHGARRAGSHLRTIVLAETGTSLRMRFLRQFKRSLTPSSASTRDGNSREFRLNARILAQFLVPEAQHVACARIVQEYQAFMTGGIRSKRGGSTRTGRAYVAGQPQLEDTLTPPITMYRLPVFGGSSSGVRSDGDAP